jgi:hypothetical protein
LKLIKQRREEQMRQQMSIRDLLQRQKKLKSRAFTSKEFEFLLQKN